MQRKRIVRDDEDDERKRERDRDRDRERESTQKEVVTPEQGLEPWTLWLKATRSTD
jgi:hypothetical protein